ncbi:MAG: fasciclin domain-containing protein [Dysgonamonadaceae bacterium]|jgi:uncharacterized surface protein with fasciclin (FAS1) repeats|nr:fasciclin domain-containing protein [Dysgonamonadaceae bacterium]
MIRNKNILLVSLFIVCFSYSCEDAKDEHFNRSDALPLQNLVELIAEDSDLSVFSELISIAACDTLLASTQSFTVWAPNNSALSSVNIKSITQDEARLIVENHIARHIHTTSDNPERGVRMKSNKVYFFAEGGSSFGNVDMQKHDILAKNGVLHTLKSQIQFFPNIYEYILTSPNTSKLAQFISQFDEEIIDPLSIDADGTIRDTVYIRYNRLFDATETWNWYGTVHTGLGAVSVEDSIYTALIPDNAAWDAAYERISPLFKTTKGNDSIQRLQTYLAIVEDLIFRGETDNPAGKDSMVSTSPSIIHQPAYLFSGAQKIKTSNGFVFLAENTINFPALETFQKPIFVEADEQDGRKTAANTTIIPRIIDGDTAGLATDSRFLEVYQTTLDDNMENQPKITFNIPQTLSGKYNIFVEFLPGEMAQQGQPRATKLRCTLNYQNVNGNITTAIANNLQTSATDKVKLLLFKDFTFPVANYYDRLWQIDFVRGLHSVDERVVATKLDIAVRVSASEFNSRQFGRSFCVDRIIFEPVEN